MRNPVLISLAIVTLVLAGCRDQDDIDSDSGDPSAWELKPPLADAKPREATLQHRGVYPVGSRIKDRHALAHV